MRRQNTISVNPFVVPLKPLVKAIRALVASSIALSCNITTVLADAELPIAEDPITHHHIDVTSSLPGEIINLPTLSGSAKEHLNGHDLVINPSDNAIINWNSFNIGKGYTVDFKQLSSASVVLNDIGGGDASKIFGELHANGQVYLFNQDGFIFEKGSSVNVNALVATTLGISQSVLQTGISNIFNKANQANPGTVASQGAALNSTNATYLQDKNGHFILDKSGNKISVSLAPIDVQSGASISANAAGGLIMLAAATINNQGNISAANGQVILAAAKDKVYLQDSTDSSVRGLLVEVGTGGEVNNSGSVYAKNGNISMIGFAVNQDGIVSASTSVQLNGQIRLQAQEGIQNPSNTSGVLTGANTLRSADLGDGLGQSAKVNLGANSLTSVALDQSDATARAVQSQPKSIIDIDGHQVNFASGSLVQAHSGTVNVKAQDDLSNASTKGDARIYMASGSKIDVSGLKNVTESVRNNVVSIKLQSNELRDSPTQRTGVLYGKTVSVDIRNATISYDSSGNPIATVPIADISYPVQAMENTIAERNVTGGEINLQSSGDVIIHSGAQLDISGGSIAYQGDTITTSALLANNGQLYNFGTASPNLVYTSIVNQTGYSPGYTQGAAAGSLHISGYNALLDGNLQAQANNGNLQRGAANQVAGGSLSIDLANGNQFGYQDVVFSNHNSGLNLSATQSIPLNSVNQTQALNLNSAMLSQSGLQNISISTNGAAVVQQNANISLAGTGLFQIDAHNINVQGSIINPSGNVTLQPIIIGNSNQINAINLGSSAVIDVSGLWVNDWLAIQHNQGLSPIDINGGTISLMAEQANLTLQKGSRLIADAGAWQQNNNTLTAGSAGAISLTAASHNVLNSANVILNGGLSAWGLQQDGSLNIKTGEILIANQADQINKAQSSEPLILTNQFFANAGFANYNLVSNVYGLSVADNTTLNLQQHNLQLESQALFTPSGIHLQQISQKVLLPDYQRKADNLSLGFSEVLTQNRQQALTLGKGSDITTDAGGSVTLNSDTSIFANGIIDTPAGNIALNTTLPNNDFGYFAAQGIWLGANSQLLATGAVNMQPTNANLITGNVKNAGTVSLTANRGYIVTEPGSLINVSGVSAPLDVLQNTANGVNYARETIASNAGSINFRSGQGIIAEGNLAAHAGGANALGGSFSITQDRTLLNEPTPALASGKFPDQTNPLLNSVLTISTNNASAHIKEGSDVPNADSNQAQLHSSLINAAGFSALNLQTDTQTVAGKLTSAIVFDGNVSLNASRQILLDTPNLETTANTHKVTISAPYVALGSTQVNQSASGNLIAPTAVSGSAKFNVVNAQGIDLRGGLAFNGFNAVNLQSQGDVRMIGDQNIVNKNYLGALNLAGDMKITASRIYPATLSQYSLNVSGTATFASNQHTNKQVPLSADGQISVNATNIYQNGVIDAPFGSINLIASQDLQLATNSLTSVSGAGSVIPFGVGAGGSEWLYPLNNNESVNIVVNANNLPEKNLSLNAPHLDLQSGATINLNGGGDLYAYEFIAGNGGSKDVLNTGSSFAVIPGIYNMLTPYDPTQYASSGLSALGMGESVYLNAGAGLAAGWYTLLPAHYALLPGAFLVTPVAGTTGQVQNSQTTSGYTVVPGYYGVAGTSVISSLAQGFEVQPGSLFTGSIAENANGGIRVNSNNASPSQFSAYLADNFFAAQALASGSAAPQLPQDAGSLLLAAADSLTLDASLLATPTGKGLGGQVSISATKLEVVGNSADLQNLTAGSVGILSSQLNHFKAPSLLLGGKRSQTNKGDLLIITASNVTVDSDVTGKNALSGQEIMLAAINQVTVAKNAEVISSGNSAAAGQTVILENNYTGSNGKLLSSSDGALLRVANSGQDTIVRDETINGNTGTLSVDQGAVLKSGVSMLLDSSLNTQFYGTIDMNSGALALNSSRISIGDAPAGTPGLVLSTLPSNLNSISFNSRGDFDLYGAAAINSQHIAINAATINGFNNDGSSSTIGQSGNTDSISINNSSASSSRSGNGSGTLTLAAKDIVLGSGQYAINGFNQVNLNASDAISGLGSGTNSSNGNSITAMPGVLTVTGNQNSQPGQLVLNLQAGQFIGGDGATTQINAENYTVNISAANSANLSMQPGLGASWNISGSSINSSAAFNLPAGNLSLSATGNNVNTQNSNNVNLQTGSSIDLSGRAVSFANTDKAAAGGKLSLQSSHGDVDIASGSQVKLYGAILNNQQISNAGSLNVQAPKGKFDWGGVGTIDANGGASTVANGIVGGSAQISAANFGTGGFSTLNQQLATAGFNQQLSIDQTQGDISILSGDNVTAHQIQISADQGSVTLAGTIDASGSQAGNVIINGENGITLSSSANILANAKSANNAGGTVTLDSVYKNAAGSGLLDLSAGGAINVSAAGSGNGGSVHLRTGRNDANDQVNVTPISTQFTGVGSQGVALEATRIYSDINQGTTNANFITADNINQWQTDTANFMTATSQLNATGGALALPSGVTLMPGIEVRSSGDLTLTTPWDFEAGGSGWSSSTYQWNSGWRYGDAQVPGFLTLSAGGNLDINASISDALAITPIPTDTNQDQVDVFQDVIQTGHSWSYNLNAGGNVNLAADYSAADPLGSGAMVNTQVVVRTGTGDINIAAGGNIIFNKNAANTDTSNNASAVYTVGTTALYSLGDLVAGQVPGMPAQQSGQTLQAYLSSLDQNKLNQLLRYGLLDDNLLGANYLYAEYPSHGGNINLSAGGDIQGVQTGQAMTDWLVRSSGWDNGAANASNSAATAWGINISGNLFSSSTSGSISNGNTVWGKDNRNFNQNVGALGGGNVNIQAGGNVNTLSVMLPTTGKPLGVLSSAGVWNSTNSVPNGGGNLQINAGNNISGGEFYVASGTGNLSAEGAITQASVPASNQKVGVVLDLGDGVFNLQARQDINLSTVMNPTLFSQTNLPNSGQTQDSRFFTYGADSGVNLQSVAGNIAFLNNAATVAAMDNLPINSADSGIEYGIYPGSVSAAALTGDIHIDNSMTLYPSKNGNLQLLASNNIGIDSTATNGQTITVSMSDVDPGQLPGVNNPASSLDGDYATSTILTRELLDPFSKLPQTTHALVPLHINSSDKPLIDAVHGNIAFAASHQASFILPESASILAGGNIINISALAQNIKKTDVTRIEAGGSISYDTPIDDNGVFLSNNQSIKVSGPGQLQVIAGDNINLGGSTGIESIGNFYNPALSSEGASIQVLAGVAATQNYNNFITKYQTSYANELQGLSKLSSDQQRNQLNKLLNVLFKEISRSAALAAVAPENNRYALYQIGYQAANALFPSSHKYTGDIDLVFSQIKTLAGGSVDLLTPGGSINVGLAGTLAGISKGASQLGIVVQEQGSLNILSHGDVNVNQSRVFTLGGGDITAWSSKGSIDAGKGAKSSISAPAPVTTVNAQGQIVTTFPPIISGSGIQAIGGGSVYLAAPVGVVNAGEAGISGNNIVIAATAVVGASNIQSTGSTIGVPTAVAPPPVTGADSAAASASKTATQNSSMDNTTAKDDSSNAKNTVSVLSMDIIGFGSCSVGDIKETKKGCGS